MLNRKIEKNLKNFYENSPRKALLITGSRQVGKTFIIREFAKSHYKSFVEINFLENRGLTSDLFYHLDTKELMQG